jgi:putative acetyltransferase
MINVRTETIQDVAAVRRVNELAFGQSLEANLVDALRENAQPQISLVATNGNEVVGHIFFSPVTLEPDQPHLSIMGLAPMGVLPDLQRHGIGSQLVRAGLTECDQLGCDAVVVLGHPEFYPRFGFIPASRKGLRCEYPVPDDVFMVLELKSDAITAGGLVKYRPEFSSV